MPITSVNASSPTERSTLFVEICRESPTGFRFIYRWKGGWEVIFTKINDLQVFMKDLPVHLWKIEDESCIWSTIGEDFIQDKKELIKEFWEKNTWMKTLYWAGCYRHRNGLARKEHM